VLNLEKERAREQEETCVEWTPEAGGRKIPAIIASQHFVLFLKWLNSGHFLELH
jgi:hypothetical protein